MGDVHDYASGQCWPSRSLACRVQEEINGDNARANSVRLLLRCGERVRLLPNEVRQRHVGRRTLGVRHIHSARFARTVAEPGLQGRIPSDRLLKPGVAAESRAISSVGQSACSTRRRSEVQVLYRPVSSPLPHQELTTHLTLICDRAGMVRKALLSPDWHPSRAMAAPGRI